MGVSYGGSDMRLAKHLAHAGVASRRAAEQLIFHGHVTVGGKVVTDPATDVDGSKPITVDGRPVGGTQQERAVYILNKPPGVVSTSHDTHGRKTVVDLVHADRRLYPVGRLDADSTGLILLTNDGELADLLTHPRYGVDKVYRAKVQPARVSPRAIQALREGVALEDGRTAPAKVRQVAPGLVEITLREGRKRQVRRMCEAVGHRVVDLRRVAFGSLRLGDLAAGRHRRLTAAEVERLRKDARGGAARRA
jgi:23S rRNA pseudouridine2605 synthase